MLFSKEFFVARQPIFDQDEKLWGFELLFRKNLTQNYADINDPEAASVHVASCGFLQATSGTSSSLKIFYMNEHAQKLLRTKGETPEFVNTTDFYVDPGRRKHFLSLVTSAGFLKEYEIEFIDSLGVRFWGMVSSKRIVYNNEDAILSTIIDISLRKKLEEELVYSSSHDFLTGVFNRRHFSSVMTSEVVRSKRYSTSLSLVMIALDNFKIVNDVHGHIVGDEILKHFCTIVRENLRQTDTLGRVGGEEFAVLLPETDLIGAEKFAERVRSTVSLAEFV